MSHGKVDFNILKISRFQYFPTFQHLKNSTFALLHISIFQDFNISIFQHFPYYTFFNILRCTYASYFNISRLISRYNLEEPKSNVDHPPPLLESSSSPKGWSYSICIPEYIHCYSINIGYSTTMSYSGQHNLRTPRRSVVSQAPFLINRQCTAFWINWQL